eukprot:4626452-Amphidinium_carterae.1
MSAEGEPMVTFLAGVCSKTRHLLGVTLPRKGTTEHAVTKCAEWIKSLGHRKVIVQHDGEPAIKKLAEDVQMSLPGVEFVPRESGVMEHE